MDFNEEQFATVKEMVEKAHENWGDYTGTGLTYEILNFLSVDPKEREAQELREKARQAVADAPRYIAAIKAVREVTLWGLREAKDFVDSIKPANRWPEYTGTW